MRMGGVGPERDYGERAPWQQDAYCDLAPVCAHMPPSNFAAIHFHVHMHSGLRLARLVWSDGGPVGVDRERRPEEKEPKN